MTSCSALRLWPKGYPRRARGLSLSMAVEFIADFGCIIEVAEEFRKNVAAGFIPISAKLFFRRGIVEG